MLRVGFGQEAEELDRNSTLLSPMVDLAASRASTGKNQTALEWCRLASSFARTNAVGTLRSVELQGVVDSIAVAALPHSDFRPSDEPHPRRVLHVVTQASEIGGLTRLVERWIVRDTGSVSSAVVTRQDRVVDSLTSAAIKSGGKSSPSVATATTPSGAVGPRPADEPWPELRRRFGERVLVAGPVHDLRPFLRAADFYIDTFPVLSTTSQLEAAAMALPTITLDTHRGYRRVLDLADFVEGEENRPTSVTAFQHRLPSSLSHLRRDTPAGRAPRKAILPSPTTVPGASSWPRCTHSWGRVELKRSRSKRTEPRPLTLRFMITAWLYSMSSGESRSSGRWWD